MTEYIAREEFGDAPWALLNKAAARREALVAAVAERGWYVEAEEEDEGCVTQEELDDDFAEAAAAHGFRHNGITWED